MTITSTGAITIPVMPPGSIAHRSQERAESRCFSGSSDEDRTPPSCGRDDPFTPPKGRADLSMLIATYENALRTIVNREIATGANSAPPANVIMTASTCAHGIRNIDYASRQTSQNPVPE